MSTIASPLRLKGTPPAYTRPPPLLGDDTDVLLLSVLGYDADRIEALRGKGVV